MNLLELYQEYLYAVDKHNNLLNDFRKQNDLPIDSRLWSEGIFPDYFKLKVMSNGIVKAMHDQLYRSLQGKCLKINDKQSLTAFQGQILTLENIES